MKTNNPFQAFVDEMSEYGRVMLSERRPRPPQNIIDATKLYVQTATLKYLMRFPEDIPRCPRCHKRYDIPSEIRSLHDNGMCCFCSIPEIGEERNDVGN